MKTCHPIVAACKASVHLPKWRDQKTGPQEGPLSILRGSTFRLLLEYICFAQGSKTGPSASWIRCLLGACLRRHSNSVLEFSSGSVSKSLSPLKCRKWIWRSFVTLNIGGHFRYYILVATGRGKTHQCRCPQGTHIAYTLGSNEFGGDYKEVFGASAAFLYFFPLVWPITL